MITVVYKVFISFVETGPESERQPVFLKVGSWVYPLIPGQSPVLKSHLGKYMFPDLDDTIEGENSDYYLRHWFHTTTLGPQVPPELRAAINVFKRGPWWVGEIWGI